MTTHNQGLASTLFAYLIWGLLPVYWKWLSQVSAMELLCHRVLWSLVITLLLFCCAQGKRLALKEVLGGGNVLRGGFTALLLAVNWLLYIWAVNSGYVVESSLGYFINPLFVVLLGVVVLNERLRPMQWLALGIAGAGVLYMTLALGQFPWIALSLTITFGLYSLLRKITCIPPLEGLMLEMGLLAIPCIGYSGWLVLQGEAQFVHASPRIMLLLIGTGLITTIPLLLFIHGTRQISMTAAGILQYLAPTLQFLLGIALYHEPFPLEKQIGFGLIWLALALYSVDQLRGALQRHKRLLHSCR